MAPADVALPTAADVLAAAARLVGVAHRTPVLTSRSLDELAAATVSFKCENLQRVGAFKFRGAGNAVLSLSGPEAARGVATHSSGNHAAALALAARLRGIRAHVVMPTTSREAKKRAVAAYGAAITFCEPNLAAREATLADVVERTGATFIHPYDDPRVIAGQGTAALELLAERPDLDVLLAPVGGGGLLSGTCLAVAAAGSRARVIGAEPAGADDAARSLAAGRLILQTDPRTIADGLLTSLSARTFALIRQRADTIVTVAEDAIAAAMRLIWERLKVIIEPSSAVAVAALLARGDLFAGRRVGVILSGGNVDLEVLPWRK